jgi:hypothetical protein
MHSGTYNRIIMKFSVRGLYVPGTATVSDFVQPLYTVSNFYTKTILIKN